MSNNNSNLTKDQGKFSAIPILKHILHNEFYEVKQLIEKSIDQVHFVHAKSGDTPMIVAARYKRYEILKLLHEQGADIEQKNMDGKRPLHEAALSGCMKCTSYILKQNVFVDPIKRADWTPLMFATANGHLDVTRELIKYGADVNRINKDGWNSFHLACREGLLLILDYLLVKVNASQWKTRSNNLRTPLHTAAMHGQLTTITYLLKHGAYQKDEKDSCGTTPLMDSLRFGFVDVADCLIKEHGADIYTTDSIGRSCVHIAAHSGQIDSIKYLVEACNVNVESPCLDSTTSALHFAAKEGHKDVLEYILSAGGNVNAVDKNNRTALHLSTASNKLDIVELLLTHYKADADVVDNCGKKASQYTFNEKSKIHFK